MTRTNGIGELRLQNGQPLMKMWTVEVDPCTRPFLRHAHTRFEITVIQSGSGEYTTENAIYPIQAGDVFVFSSNEVHSITQVGESGLSMTNLHFEPRYLMEGEGSDGILMDFCFSHSPDFQNRIPAEKGALLRENHSRIREEFVTGDAAQSTAIRSYLNLMLVDLIRRHGYRSGEEKKSVMPSILPVYHYIDEHLGEKLTLAELAGVAGLSPNYLSHVFKQLNGMGLWDYVIARRIERATKMILSGGQEMTMLQIALDCGFNNTVNFNKAFKRQKGYTPSELKKDPGLSWH